MDRVPRDEPPQTDGGGNGFGVGVAVLLILCCAGVPLLATGGAGLLAGLLTDTWPGMVVGLALMLAGGALLWRHWNR